jgi:hypothetical protein
MQGSRTIRTEEAVLIGLSKLSPFLAKSEKSNNQKQEDKATPPLLDFSNDGVSEESSSEED